MTLTQEESKKLVELLGKLQRPYPPEVFYALCLNLVVSAVELILLTKEGRVLLLQRPDDDPFFASLWHMPGSVRLKGDSTADVLSRIVATELSGMKHTTPVEVFAQSVMSGDGPDQGARGQEEARVFMAWVNEGEDSGPGKFFSLDAIPDNTVRHHKVLHLPRIKAMFNDLLGSLQ